ncbi:preprotein translocase subunit YajC [Streptacidiphilus sp. PB12-B1b]|uniref:preprotein translocase subunit YajC n=1 Tax=Streptacidiphilus sp. PB12-B1b TaxID=2705012 RepID=UPI0015FE7E58|nr:preprotein translocase subunit YajC [Streptacidiphilus sp. PB12-B1b]QMU76401.1 preprotein translocase subunit YajC [Streptacidiphilus sp. PB12-B1b]
MSIVSLLPIILIGGMLFLMMRSSKNKQQQAQQMRNKLEPGVGIRTIGGMYALVKEVREEAVELEVAPGVHAIYAKNAIATVMDGVEYNRIVHGDEPEDLLPEYEESESGEAPADEAAAESPVLLGKADAAEAPADAEAPAVAAETGAGDKAVSSK